MDHAIDAEHINKHAAKHAVNLDRVKKVIIGYLNFVIFIGCFKVSPL